MKFACLTVKEIPIREAYNFVFIAILYFVTGRLSIIWSEKINIDMCVWPGVYF